MWLGLSRQEQISGTAVSQVTGWVCATINVSPVIMTPASYSFSGPKGKAGKNLDPDTVNFSYLRAMNLQLANTAGDGVCADCSEMS